MGVGALLRKDDATVSSMFMNIPVNLNTNIVVLANMFLAFLDSLVLKQIFGQDKQIVRIQLYMNSEH